jgi:hypothetical protein
MTEGLLVLAGVLIGGLLNYWIQLGIERRRRTAQAKTAARLVMDELFWAASLLRTLVDAGIWEPWHLLTSFHPITWSRWHTWQADLAGNVDWDTYADTAGAVMLFEQVRLMAVAAAGDVVTDDSDADASPATSYPTSAAAGTGPPVGTGTVAGAPLPPPAVLARKLDDEDKAAFEEIIAAIDQAAERLRRYVN